MSVLVETSALKAKVSNEIPKGSFNHSTQTWEFEGVKITNLSSFSIFMGTSTPTTYSATTNIGKDQDADDRGT